MNEICAKKAWKRREEILRIIESIGTIHISKAELARKYGVSPRQITKDFEVISGKISKPSKKELTFNVNIVFEFVFNKLLEICRNEKLKPMDKVKALTSLINAVDKKIDSLIKLGLIKPAEENISIQHSPDSKLNELVIATARKSGKEKTTKMRSNKSCKVLFLGKIASCLI